MQRHLICERPEEIFTNALLPTRNQHHVGWPTCQMFIAITLQVIFVLRCDGFNRPRAVRLMILAPAPQCTIDVADVRSFRQPKPHGKIAKADGTILEKSCTVQRLFSDRSEERRVGKESR